MNFNNLSALKGAWAIEPKSVAAFAMVAAEILKTGNFETLKQEIAEPYALSQNNEEAQSDDKVAIIPMLGPLMKHSERGYGLIGDKERGKWLQNAYADSSVSAIVLFTDTPGGTVEGTEEFVEILNSRNKPVLQFVEGMSCSKGVWIGSNCDKIISANDHNETGSIGVMVSMTDFVPMLEKWGAKSHNVVADQSKDKNKVFYDLIAGDYKAIKEEMLNPLADAFISTVKKNRPNVTKEQLTGKVFFAKDVVGSLIDGIGNLDFAIKEALSLTNNNSNSNNSNAMSEKEKISAEEKSLMEKMGKFFGLKTAEEKREALAKTALEAKKTDAENIAKDLEEIKQQNTTAQSALVKANEENAKLLADIVRLKELPGAGSLDTKIETDGKGEQSANVVDDKKSWDENYQACGKAWGFIPN